MLKRSVLALVLVALLALSGCVSDGMPAPTALPPMNEKQIESRDELYALYNQIDFNMTVSELEDTLGPAIHEEVSLEKSTGLNLKWERDGVYTAVAVSDGLIIGKAIETQDPRLLSKLTPVPNFENVHKIERNMNYSQIVEIMGCEGLEVLARINRDQSPITINRLMRWFDASGSVMQIMFNQDGTISTEDNSSKLYPFPTLEPGATYAPTATPDPEASPRPTCIPTAVPTEAPTEVPTEAPTEASTQTPTEAPTEAPTQTPTEAPTEAPTKAPTQAPTQAPTKAA